MKLKPKNWSKFQHYNHRTPPWIKLHRDLLNNRDFMGLDLASKGLAPLLWLLASESPDGTFDASTEELVFRLRVSTKDVMSGLKPLIDKGFFEVVQGDASTVLAPCLQHATSERERETETEKETEKNKKSVPAPPVFPKGLDTETFRMNWDQYVQYRKERGLSVLKPSSVKAKLMEMDQWGHQAAITAIGLTISNGWQGIFPPPPTGNKPTTMSVNNSKFASAF